MRRLGFCLAVGLVIGASVNAFAAVVPQCGDVSRKTVKPVFDVAQSVKRSYNAVKPIEDACKIMEKFESWERKNKQVISSDAQYESKKDPIVDDMAQAISDLRAPLVILRGVLLQKPKTEEEEMVREGKIEEAKQDINDKMGRLESAAARVSGFVDGGYSYSVEQKSDKKSNSSIDKNPKPKGIGDQSQKNQ